MRGHPAEHEQDPLAHEDELQDAQDESEVLGRLLKRSGLVLGVVLLLACAGLALATQFGDAGSDLLDLHPADLVAAIAVYVVLQTTLMILWQRLLHRLHGGFGGPKERRAWSVSQLGKYVPTGAMLIVARVMLATRAGGSRRAAFNSALYEFGASFGAALIISALAIGSMDELDDSLFRWVVYVAPVAVLVGLHPRVFVPLANFALRKAGRDDLDHALSFPAVVGFVAAYTVALLIGGLGILALVDGLDAMPEGNDTLLVLATFSVGYVASVLGFLLPGGLGVRESGMALALSSVVPTSTAVTVAIVSRLVQVVVECAMAAGLAAAGRRT